MTDDEALARAIEIYEQLGRRVRALEAEVDGLRAERDALREENDALRGRR